MAQNTREIRRRIRSVQSTQKITSAMEMVAAAKLRRAQERVVTARPYTAKLHEVLERLFRSDTDFEHPFIEVSEEGKVGYVVISGDSGLAGGYNVNILRFAQRHVDSHDENAAIIALGRKGRDYFRYRGYPLLQEYINIGDLPTYIQAVALAEELTKLYHEGTLREVNLVYNKFITPLRQDPVKIQLLPIAASVDRREGEEEEVEYIFEPSPAGVLDELLPKYVNIEIYQALLEAKASEHGARMTAMGSATDNAEEIIDKLNLSYNRARQTAITTEISEIVGGAEALQGS
ncbi:MAG: F0F1 ATP synthase subunit gamma [Clostridia bacterium]|nr:F0F1 ATP synthase subunit gamma [Clostridia bacterium]